MPTLLLRLQSVILSRLKAKATILLIIVIEMKLSLLTRLTTMPWRKLIIMVKVRTIWIASYQLPRNDALKVWMGNVIN
ncbi:MAG: hypothetical protein KAI83_14535 [Thiomargarita sp.]|nr:hypothetical protein [Thiomargarita sp.]